MIWPFVSRARLTAAEQAAHVLELALRDAHAVREALTARAEAAERRYDALVHETLAMKREGYAMATTQTLPRPEMPDAVTEAILVKAGTDARLRKHYAEYVAAQRAFGVSDEQIAADIYAGDDVTDYGVPG